MTTVFIADSSTKINSDDVFNHDFLQGELGLFTFN